jgi:hypothetical protein
MCFTVLAINGLFSDSTNLFDLSPFARHDRGGNPIPQYYRGDVVGDDSINILCLPELHF